MSCLAPRRSRRRPWSCVVAAGCAGALLQEAAGQEPFNIPGQNSSSGLPTLSSSVSFVLVLCVGAFACASLWHAVAGYVVAAQYPFPRFFCWRTPYSDLAGARGCCSLYRGNAGFLLLWLVLLIISSVARNLMRLGVCAVFAALHVGALLMLRRKFRRFGPPGTRPPPHLMLPQAEAGQLQLSPRSAPGAGEEAGGLALLGPALAAWLRSASVAPAEGLPVYSIPLIKAEVGTPGVEDFCPCACCCLERQQPQQWGGGAAAGDMPASATAVSARAAPHRPADLQASPPTMALDQAASSSSSGDPTSAAGGPHAGASSPAPPGGGQSEAGGSAGPREQARHGAPPALPPPVLATPVPPHLVVVDGVPLLTSRRVRALIRSPPQQQQQPPPHPHPQQQSPSASSPAPGQGSRRSARSPRQQSARGGLGEQAGGGRRGQRRAVALSVEEVVAVHSLQASALGMRHSQGGPQGQGGGAGGREASTGGLPFWQFLGQGGPGGGQGRGSRPRSSGRARQGGLSGREQQPQPPGANQ